MEIITDSIFYTGLLNPNLRVFDVIMRTEYGTSYNSYLVRGSEKTALIETGHATFTEYYLENIKRALAGKAADFLVLNHCEPDHTGCVEALLELFPDITVVVSQAGSIYLKNIVNRPDINIRAVKDGDSISLGDMTLQFISAPFLHWPDSMFTWVPEKRVLFTCDFLGCHYCEPQVFDSRIAYGENYSDAAKYYYDCIFAPFGAYVRKGLNNITCLDIDFACPSHGPVLTKDGLLPEIIRKYNEWSSPVKHANKRIPIFYCSAYGNTSRLADGIKEGIHAVLPDADVPIYNIIEHDMSEMAGKMNDSDAFLIGSPTINRDAVAPVWQLLAGIEAIGIQKRPVALFGSFGWSGEALGNIAQRLATVKAAVFEKQFKVNFVPTAADFKDAKHFGEAFAMTI